MEKIGNDSVAWYNEVRISKKTTLSISGAIPSINSVGYDSSNFMRLVHYSLQYIIPDSFKSETL